MVSNLNGESNRVFKTIFARFGNIKAGKFVDDETGEKLNDVAKVLSKFNIELFDAQGNMRNVGSVLDEINSRWANLTQVEKNAISTAVAGTRQRENFIVLMENYGKAADYTQTALESAGTAEEKFSKYTEGVEAKTNKLKATFEEFARNLIDSGLVKGFLDMETVLVKILDKLKLVQIAFIALIAVGAKKGLEMLNSKLIELSISSGKYVAAMQTQKISLDGLNAKQALSVLISKNQISKLNLETKETIKQSLVNYGLAESEAEVAAAKIASTAVTNTQTVSLNNLTKAVWLHIKALGKQTLAMMFAHPVITAIIAVVGVFAGVLIQAATAEKKLKEKVEQTNQAYDEAKSALDEINTQLEDNEKRIKNLESKPNLTYVEEEELQKLRETNLLLKEQQLIKEEDLKKKHKEKALAKYSQLESKRNSNQFRYYSGSEEELNEKINTLNEEILNLEIKRDEAYKENKTQEVDRLNDEINSKRSELYELNTLINDFDNNSIIQQYKNLQGQAGKIDEDTRQAKMQAIEDEINDYLILYQNFLSDISGMSEEEANRIFGEENIKSIKEEYKNLMLIFHEGEYKQIRWEEILGKDEFKNVAKEIQEFSKTASNAAEAIEYLKKRFPGFIDALIEAGVITDKNDDTLLGIVNRLLAINTVLEENKEKVEELKKTQEEYNNAVKYAVYVLEKEKEKLQGQKEAIEDVNKELQNELDYYDQALSYINKFINSKIDALQKEKDLLEEKNDEKEREIELEKLQENLNKAKQRTMRVYYEDRGWVWESDQGEVKKAEKELKDYQDEQEKNKEQEELDKQIESWKEYLKLWEEIPNKFKEESDMLAFFERQGFVTEEDLLNKRTNGLEEFAKAYLAKQKEIANNKTELDDLNDKIKTYDKLIKTWNDIPKEYEANSTLLNDAMKTGELTREQILSGDIAAIKNFQEKYSKYMGMTAEDVITEVDKINEALAGIVSQYSTEEINWDIRNRTSSVERGKFTESDFVKIGDGQWVKMSDVERPGGKNSPYINIKAGTPIYSHPYASGTKYSRSGLANVDENGKELIIPPPRRGRYAMLEAGSGVVPHNLTERLFDIASNPLRYIANAIKSPILSRNSSNNSSTTNISIGNISLPNVNNGDSFVRELQIISKNR